MSFDYMLFDWEFLLRDLKKLTHANRCITEEIILLKKIILVNLCVEETVIGQHTGLDLENLGL